MSRLIAALTTAARTLFTGTERADSATPDGPIPAGEFETLALQFLREAHTVNLQELIERVAEAALRAEIRRGGWAIDAGVWGPTIYRHEATLAVQRLVGRTLVLEDDGALLAVWATSPGTV
jgi:hypothetical protein